MKTSGIEKQVDAFNDKVKADSLKAFNDILSTFKVQNEHVKKLNADIDKQKKLLTKWAEEAHYQVNWDKFTASVFQSVGKCLRCSQENVGLVDYNGHNYMVCETCDRILENEFDEDYK
jgi:hypothetical protein